MADEPGKGRYTRIAPEVPEPVDGEAPLYKARRMPVEPGPPPAPVPAWRLSSIPWRRLRAPQWMLRLLGRG